MGVTGQEPREGSRGRGQDEQPEVPVSGRLVGAQDTTSWRQAGFVLVSRAGELPLVHSFHLPRWEAESAAEQARKLPSELVTDLQVVPATLEFELPAAPAAADAARAGRTDAPLEGG